MWQYYATPVPTLKYPVLEHSGVKGSKWGVHQFGKWDKRAVYAKGKSNPDAVFTKGARSVEGVQSGRPKTEHYSIDKYKILKIGEGFLTKVAKIPTGVVLAGRVFARSVVSSIAEEHIDELVKNIAKNNLPLGIAAWLGGGLIKSYNDIKTDTAMLEFTHRDEEGGKAQAQNTLLGKAKTTLVNAFKIGPKKTVDYVAKHLGGQLLDVAIDTITSAVNVTNPAVAFAMKFGKNFVQKVYGVYVDRAMDEVRQGFGLPAKIKNDNSPYGIFSKIFNTTGWLLSAAGTAALDVVFEDWNAQVLSTVGKVLLKAGTTTVSTVMDYFHDVVTDNLQDAWID